MPAYDNLLPLFEPACMSQHSLRLFTKINAGWLSSFFQRRDLYRQDTKEKKGLPIQHFTIAHKKTKKTIA